MDIRIHPSCKPLKKIIAGFMADNPALSKATDGFALLVGPSSEPHFSTPPHAQDAIFVGDSAHIAGYKASAELDAMFKKDPASVLMRPTYDSVTRKWTYDVMKAAAGAMDAAVAPLVGQTYSPWNVSWFQKVFKEPLLYSHAKEFVSIEQGTNPWAELMTLMLEQYAGFAIAAGTGSAANNMVNDVNVKTGIMTAPVINISVTYTLSIEELERAKQKNNPFAGQAITRKQSYANYVIDMLTDYIIFYGNAETDTQGILDINPIEAWPGDSLSDIAAGSSTTKGADAYTALFKRINTFLDASDNKFEKIKVGMSPQAYNLLTSLPYSDSFNPTAAMKIFQENYQGGAGKDKKLPNIEFVSDPMLKANSIFNPTSQDYLVITAPEIKAGPDEEVQGLLPFGAPLMNFVFPAIPGQYNTQYKTLRRVAGVFAPVPIAAKVYVGFGK